MRSIEKLQKFFGKIDEENAYDEIYLFRLPGISFIKKGQYQSDFLEISGIFLDFLRKAI